MPENMTRTYREIRKTYVTARIAETGRIAPPYATNWRRYHKEESAREFDQFVAEQRRIAVEQYIEGSKIMATEFKVGTKVKANPNTPHTLMMSVEAPEGVTGKVVATQGVGADDYMVQWDNSPASWGQHALSYGHADLLEATDE